VERVTTSGAVEYELRVIDAREVEGASGLHLAHGEAERPRVNREIIDDHIGEIGAVHLGHDIVVVDVGGVLEESGTVNVEGRGAEVVFIRPVATRRRTRNKVERLDGVVEITEINIRIGVGRELILGLGNEKFVLGISEILALIGIKINVVTIDLWGATRGWSVSITALHTDLDVVVLEGNEGKSLGPVLAEEEGDHVMVTSMILLTGVSGHSERSLSGRVAHEGVVDTLNVEGIELGHLLTTNPERELSGLRSVVGEKTVGILLISSDTIGLDPDVAHEITLGANGDRDLVGITEGTDVIHALGLHGEVGVALVVLTEKADLGRASDVHILSTD
jgi:hypothetical protein